MQSKRQPAELAVSPILITVLAFASIPGQVRAQAEETRQVVGTFEQTTSTWILPSNDAKKIERQGVALEKANAVFGAVRKYQAQRKEKLGVELTVDENGRLQARARNDLPGNTVAVTQNNLKILTDSYLSEDRTLDNLTSRVNQDLVEQLRGGGIYEENESRFRIQNGVPPLQTIDPPNTGISNDDIANLAKTACIINRTSCPSDHTEINKATPANLNLIANERDEKVIQCKKARSVFNEFIESNQELANTGNNWRTLENAQEIAANFDRACLESPQNIPTDVLENFAVIKTDDSIIPFCGAIRIGRRQFLTAMHCFQKKSGAIDYFRLHNSHLYLYSHPIERIDFDTENFPEIEDRNGNNGIAKDIPARRDYIIINTTPYAETIPFKHPTLVGTAKIGSPIVIPGYFYFNERPPRSAADWVQSIRATKKFENDYCQIYDISQDSGSGSCLIHRCQATAGYSGSPVFQRNGNGELTLIGIHTSGALAPDYHCSSQFVVAMLAKRTNSMSPIARNYNIATKISRDILLKSGWKEYDDND